MNVLTQAYTEIKTNHSCQRGKERKKVSDMSLEEQNILLRHSSFYTHMLLLPTASQICFKIDNSNLLKLHAFPVLSYCRVQCMHGKARRWKKERAGKLKNKIKKGKSCSI